MPVNTLGKILFPSRPRWERQRRTKNIIISVVLGLLAAGFIALFICWQYFHHEWSGS